MICSINGLYKKWVRIIFVLSITVISSVILAEEGSDGTFALQNLVEGNPEIIYFSDTNHNNLKLLAVYTELVTQLKSKFPEYNCIFLESDKEIFQPAIDDYMSNSKPWKGSVGLAQKKWEKITGRSYQQAPEPFLRKMKEIGIKVFAVDWPDNSIESELMKNLFATGFSGNMDSLRRAFYLGVEIRNSVMSANIAKVLFPTYDSQSTCNQAMMFVGGLHLAEEVHMPMGLTEYTSIAHHLGNQGLIQVAHEVIDCNDLDSTSSKENEDQCRIEGLKKISVPDIFDKGKTIDVLFVRSQSQTVGKQIKTDPMVKFNIMIKPQN